MSNKIAVTTSVIPPDLAGACTFCLHHGVSVWRKTYRSEGEGWNEAVELGFAKLRVVEVERYSQTVGSTLLPEAFVDPDVLQERGFLLTTTKGQ